MNAEKVTTCDECQSEFLIEASVMKSLCPECASVLYGYKNCDHHFIENRCEKCYWDGSISEFIKSLKKT